MIIPPSTKRKACQNLFMSNEASHSLNMGLCDNLVWYSAGGPHRRETAIEETASHAAGKASRLSCSSCSELKEMEVEHESACMATAFRRVWLSM